MTGSIDVPPWAQHQDATLHHCRRLFVHMYELEHVVVAILAILAKPLLEFQKTLPTRRPG